jgi:threonine synthase
VLKEIFGDQSFSAQHHLSAVNSINLARILAQCVYYLFAWLRLPHSTGSGQASADRSNLEFVVPTGNFGNVLAGWMLARMGVPVAGFKVATNRNDILHRLFTTGEYRTGEVHASLAPSMDIQVASNFERFLYYNVGGDAAQVRAIMAEMKATGAHRFTDFKPAGFSSSRATDAEITGIIRSVHDRFGYIVDPHTACAFKDLNPARVSVVLATAHSAKFPAAIRAAIGQEPVHPALEALKGQPVVKHRLPADAAAIKAFIAGRAV